ncbi:MAG: hypothetical protein JO142_12310, partial [Burkholderiales bacterium]|nr:hypothetical protein [Burkholderiales bacterium]
MSESLQSLSIDRSKLRHRRSKHRTLWITLGIVAVIIALIATARANAPAEVTTAKV